MRKILTLCLIVMLYNVSTTHATVLTKEGCINDNQGNRYSLIATNGGNRVLWYVTGTSELAIEPGVQWATKGTYDTVTKDLLITLINAHPDNCNLYADSVHVILRYTGNSGAAPLFTRNGKGEFYNYCSGGICCDGALTAAAVKGGCGALPPAALVDPKTHGGVGSTTGLEPANFSLPEGGGIFDDILNSSNVVDFNISPNPAVGRAQISMSTDEPTQVDVRIYDQFGRLIRVISSSTLDAGSYTFNWDLTSSAGTPVISGIYLVVAKVGDTVTTKRVSVYR